MSTYWSHNHFHTHKNSFIRVHIDLSESHPCYYLPQFLKLLIHIQSKNLIHVETQNKYKFQTIVRGFSS